jgi:hypothetical protein
MRFKRRAIFFTATADDWELHTKFVLKNDFLCLEEGQ